MYDIVTLWSQCSLEQTILIFDKSDNSLQILIDTNVGHYTQDNLFKSRFPSGNCLKLLFKFILLYRNVQDRILFFSCLVNNVSRPLLTLTLSMQVESFILDQEDLDNPVLKTASELLLSSAADGADLRTVDPETQARLEALLEAAGTSSGQP